MSQNMYFMLLVVTRLYSIPICSLPEVSEQGGGGVGMGEGDRGAGGGGRHNPPSTGGGRHISEDREFIEGAGRMGGGATSISRSAEE